MYIFYENNNNRNTQTLTLKLNFTDFGAMSGAVIYLKKDLNISVLKVDIVLGVFNVCSLFGSLASGRICDWIGRRYTIALAGVLFHAWAVLISCASGYGFLSVGNLACSAGVGFAFMIAPSLHSRGCSGILSRLPCHIPGGIFSFYISPATIRNYTAGSKHRLLLKGEYREIYNLWYCPRVFFKF